MTKGWVAFFAVLFVMTMGTPSVMAGTLVEFDGGIGVNGVSRVDGTAAVGDAVRNTVQGVPPGTQPWVIRRLEVKVKEHGEIKGKGKGLVLAGSNDIGTRPAGVTMVVATLFCGGVAHHSDPVPLETDGDFRLKGTLNPLPPDPCTSPRLLIRANSNSGPWLAAGILEDEDED